MINWQHDIKLPRALTITLSVYTRFESENRAADWSMVSTAAQGQDNWACTIFVLHHTRMSQHVSCIDGSKSIHLPQTANWLLGFVTFLHHVILYKGNVSETTCFRPQRTRWDGTHSVTYFYKVISAFLSEPYCAATCFLNFAYEKSNRFCFRIKILE